MNADPLAVESDLCRLTGALRALSGLLHSIPAEIDTCKADDLGYLVGCLAAEAERATSRATDALYGTPNLDTQIKELKKIRTA